jgi:ATP-dependent RNA helicase DHX36
MVKIFQEARALLGRVEYQRGHIEEALRVFDGIKVSALIPEMKISIARKVSQQKPRPYSSSPALPFHAVTVLIETMHLKALALHDLGRFEGRDPASLQSFFSCLFFQDF